MDLLIEKFRTLYPAGLLTITVTGTLCKVEATVEGRICSAALRSPREAMKACMETVKQWK